MCVKLPYMQWRMTEVSAARLVLSTLIIYINFLAYIALNHAQDLPPIILTLMKSLTLADLIFGLACQLDTWRLMLNLGPTIKTCCVLSYAINISLSVVIVILGYISYERFYAILCSKSYTNVITERKVRLFIWFSYVGSGILFIPSLLGWEVYGDSPHSCLKHWELYSSSSFLFILVLMVGSVFVSAVSYFCIAQASMSESETNKPTLSSLIDFDLEKKRAKLFLGIELLFYIMWLPFMTMTFVRLFTNVRSSDQTYSAWFNVGLGTALIKFFIYIVWLPSFRKTFSDTCYMVGLKCLDCLVSVCVTHDVVGDVDWFYFCEWGITLNENEVPWF